MHDVPRERTVHLLWCNQGCGRRLTWFETKAEEGLENDVIEVISRRRSEVTNRDRLGAMSDATNVCTSCSVRW